MEYLFDPDVIPECALAGLDRPAPRSGRSAPGTERPAPGSGRPAPRGEPEPPPASVRLPRMFDAITAAMDARYPGRIVHDQPWIYSNAGAVTRWLRPREPMDDVPSVDQETPAP